MAYTVLARKYRSQGFGDVVGQDPVSQTLKNAIECKRVAHAYIFTGTRGVGKTTMARILAKSLNCLEFDEPTVSPCCKCDSCTAINIGEDIDVIEIDGASNRGIDNIRELRQNAIYRPARGRYKIYIIDEVHMLTTEAFNALLKILEEPPEHIKFIFATTEPNKVLATIQSRCQRFDFSSIDPATIGKQLKMVLKAEKIKFTDDLVLRLSRLANGSMRDGLSLLDQLISTGAELLTLELLEEFLGEPNRGKMYELIGNIGDGEPAKVLEAIDSLLKTGQSCNQIIDSMIDNMRDLMVTMSAPDGKDLLVLTGAEQKQLAALAEKFDVPALIYDITALEKLRWSIKNSDSPRALLEASMLRFAMSEQFLGIDRLMSQMGTSGGKSRPAGVKKNYINPDRAVERANTSATAPPVSGGNAAGDGKPVEVKAVLGGELSGESVRDAWQDVIGEIRQVDIAIAGMLEKTQAGDLNGKTLTVVFAKSEKFAQSVCRNHMDKIAKLLSAALGSSINVKFETGADEGAEVSGSKISQEREKEILQDPAVRIIMAGLSATPIEVKDVEKK